MFFIANPSLAHRVRFLDIVDEQRPGAGVSPQPVSTRVVCPITYPFLSEAQFTGEVPWTEVEKHAKEAVFQAITNMTSLVGFSWNSSKQLDSHPNQSRIFTVLRSNCPRLSDVRADFVFEDVIPSHLYYRQVVHPVSRPMSLNLVRLGALTIILFLSALEFIQPDSFRVLRKPAWQVSSCRDRDFQAPRSG